MAANETTAPDETEKPAEAAEPSPAANAPPEDDGRTRDAWVRGHPDHYDFHDAEYGRIPDADPPCFERVLLACFQRDRTLVEVLDQRLDVFEFSNEWDMDAVAGAEDGALSEAAGRGGIFADLDRLKWVRDVAQACQATRDDYKELREYFLAQRWMPAEERLDEMVARFPGFTRQDAANLIMLMDLANGFGHDRDAWIYPSRKG